MSLMDKYVEIQISKLVGADWNYKMDEDEKSLALMEKLKKNLAKNGQIENLIIRKAASGKGFYEVVNGNHRLKALAAIGVKKAVCFNLGKITQAHAERIALETNETKFESDPLKMAGLVANILKDFDMDDLVETMPMDQEEIESYTKLLVFDWSQYDDDGQGGDQGAEGHEDGAVFSGGSVTLPAGHVRRIHVNQHNVKANQKAGNAEKPVITIKTTSTNWKCYGVIIKPGDCESDLKYQPTEPLACGARIWIETAAELVLRGGEEMHSDEPDIG